jgi:hypothetical protein
LDTASPPRFVSSTRSYDEAKDTLFRSGTAPDGTYRTYGLVLADDPAAHSLRAASAETASLPVSGLAALGQVVGGKGEVHYHQEDWEEEEDEPENGDERGFAGLALVLDRVLA